MAEAGLKFLLQTTPIKQSNQPELLRCLVISFGVVEWSKQQLHEYAVETIAIDTQNLERYHERLHQAMTAPASVVRFGNICLGESRDLVNSIDLLTDRDRQGSLEWLSQSEDGELVEDLLAVVHCFSCRLYGLRSYTKKVREKIVKTIDNPRQEDI